jgi:hypothetical protein
VKYQNDSEVRNGGPKLREFNGKLDDDFNEKLK